MLDRHRRGVSRSAIASLAVFAWWLAGPLGVSPASSAEEDRITLHLFGPELPFMFEVTGGAQDFAWSELLDWGDAGVETVSQGAGEVIGVDMLILSNATQTGCDRDPQLALLRGQAPDAAAGV